MCQASEMLQMLPRLSRTAPCRRALVFVVLFLLLRLRRPLMMQHRFIWGGRFELQAGLCVELSRECNPCLAGKNSTWQLQRGP